MKIKKLLAVFNTLLHSWGGDTPTKATWTANELMDAELDIDKDKLKFKLKEYNNSENDYRNFFDQLKRATDE